MAKINVRNIVLILGVTIFNISAGFYDRLFNGAGIIKLIASMGIHADSLDIKGNIFTATPDLSTIAMTNTISSFNFVGLAMFIIVLVIAISVISLTVGMSGRA